MQSKRITLKDIANTLNISLGTVHRAIYNKKGVSEDTRKKILDTAESLGYEVNLVASSLKRHPVCIAVVMPEAKRAERYFYESIWRGIDEAINELKDFNIEVLKVPFQGIDYCRQIEVLEEVYAKYADRLNGLLTVPWNDTALNPVINRFSETDVAVVTVNTDAPNSKRIACVSPPSYQVGRLAGELMSNFIVSPGKVLILGGKREAGIHYETKEGFIYEIIHNTTGLEIIEIYDSYTSEALLYEALKEFLTKFDNIKGIYSNNARNTVQISQVIKDLNLIGRIKIIGSDIFEENIKFLKDGILQAIIYQNPRIQAYKAFKTLFNHIVTTEKPSEHEYTEVSIVMKNNLQFYLE
jgi:LacI family transcriptional regulator